MHVPIKPPGGQSSLLPPPCAYPQSHATAHDLQTELGRIAANAGKCTSLYLDTVEGMSNDVLSSEGEEHHQGLARTHKLSDGSVYFFLSHSELDPGDKGSLSQYRYAGPTEHDHVLTTQPLTVAPMMQLLQIDEQHPSDITFLPDVNGLDAGYVFVTEEYDFHRLTVYRWEPNHDLTVQGRISGFPDKGPNFVFVDNVGGVYYHSVEASGRLLVASSYRWAKDEGPGGSSFVSRVDELPSS